MGLPARMDALTGLRAFAALAVVFFHFRVVAFVPEGYAAAFPVAGSLYLGVDLFFILSGFVLMHVHGAQFRRVEFGAAWRFYGLRLARIYPVHVAVLAVLVVMVLAQLVVSGAASLSPEQQERFRPEELVRHLLLVGWASPTWNPPAWSLSAEWTAYLAFPLIACAAMRLPVPACAILLAALVALLAAVYAGPFDFVLDRHGLVRVALEFPTGCLLFRLAPCLPAWLPTLSVGAAAGLAVALFGTRWGDLAALPLLMALILACAGRNLIARLLAAPPLVWLGEVSYSVYMVHVVALTFLGRLAPHVLAAFPAAGRPLMLAVSLGAVIALAAALHYTTERPARSYFRRLLRPAKGPVPEPSPAVALGLLSIAPKQG
jgi:peptidoglycan/LPS O-acetylase OafA/YrhL